MTQIFIDMDGVVADFDTGYEIAFGVRPDKAVDNVDWKLIREYGDFYLRLPPMPDFMELVEGVLQYHAAPIFLTGIPKSVPEASENKREWISKFISPDFEVITCPSWKKSEHIRNPGDIIIDDWEKHKHHWIKRGGKWITHTSAADSLTILGEIW